MQQEVLAGSHIAHIERIFISCRARETRHRFDLLPLQRCGIAFPAPDQLPVGTALQRQILLSRLNPTAGPERRKRFPSFWIREACQIRLHPQRRENIAAIDVVVACVFQMKRMTARIERLIERKCFHLHKFVGCIIINGDHALDRLTQRRIFDEGTDQAIAFPIAEDRQPVNPEWILIRVIDHRAAEVSLVQKIGQVHARCRIQAARCGKSDTAPLVQNCPSG